MTLIIMFYDEQGYAHSDTCKDVVYFELENNNKVIVTMYKAGEKFKRTYNHVYKCYPWNI